MNNANIDSYIIKSGLFPQNMLKTQSKFSSFACVLLFYLSNNRESFVQRTYRFIEGVFIFILLIVIIIAGAIRTILKILEKTQDELENRRRIETIHTTAQLELARILRRVLETRGDLLSLSLNNAILSRNLPFDMALD